MNNKEIEEVVEHKTEKKSKLKLNKQIINAESRKEYKKIWYQQNRDKQIENARERYLENTEECKEKSLKLSKKYRDGYKILMDIIKNNKLPLEYSEKVKEILN